MAGFHDLVDQILIINKFFDILINMCEVGVPNFYNIVQLATNATE